MDTQLPCNNKDLYGQDYQDNRACVPPRSSWFGSLYHRGDRCTLLWPGRVPQHHAWPFGVDTFPGCRNTPDHSQGIQPLYLTHKPLCAQSKSFWWQAPSHTYHMGLSHLCVHPCAPLNSGGSWRTSGTQGSPSSPWQPPESGRGPQWPPWPGHLRAGPPLKEEPTPVASPISRLSS